jgi:hypothetical protein
MRVQIITCDGLSLSIDSHDPKLIGAWFTEHANLLMTADARMQENRLLIWPRTHEEFGALGAQREYRFTQDDLLELAQSILDASAKMAEA